MALEDPGHRKAYAAQWRERNKDSIAAYKADYNQRNRETVLAQKRDAERRLKARLKAELGRCGEGASRVVRVDDGRVTGRSGEARRSEGPLELVRSLDECVRFDLRESDLGDPCDGAVEIGRNRIPHRVELDRG